jgi:hypothetical protein
VDLKIYSNFLPRFWKLQVVGLIEQKQLLPSNKQNRANIVLSQTGTLMHNDWDYNSKILKK